jgi:hypothetical protein
MANEHLNTQVSQALAALSRGGYRAADLNRFTQLVYVIGRVTPDHVEMLGTGFLVHQDGRIVTTQHVTGSGGPNLVVLMPHTQSLDDYQDLSDTRCQIIPVSVAEIDPIRDLAVLKPGIRLSINGPLPPLGSFDGDAVGDEVDIFGFPHCVEGRRALTLQKAEIGAKVLLDVQGIKSKHAVINIQSRPGQSGSMVFSPRHQSVSGILMGAWVPGPSGVIIAGINPRELHQTTHCVSAEYVREML